MAKFKIWQKTKDFGTPKSKWVTQVEQGWTRVSPPSLVSQANVRCKWNTDKWELEVSDTWKNYLKKKMIEACQKEAAQGVVLESSLGFSIIANRDKLVQVWALQKAYDNSWTTNMWVGDINFQPHTVTRQQLDTLEQELIEKGDQDIFGKLYQKMLDIDNATTQPEMEVITW